MQIGSELCSFSFASAKVAHISELTKVFLKNVIFFWHKNKRYIFSSHEEAQSFAKSAWFCVVCAQLFHTEHTEYTECRAERYGLTQTFTDNV